MSRYFLDPVYKIAPTEEGPTIDVFIDPACHDLVVIREKDEKGKMVHFDVCPEQLDLLIVALQRIKRHVDGD